MSRMNGDIKLEQFVTLHEHIYRTLKLRGLATLGGGGGRYFRTGSRLLSGLLVTTAKCYYRGRYYRNSTVCVVVIIGTKGQCQSECYLSCFLIPPLGLINVTASDIVVEKLPA